MKHYLMLLPVQLLFLFTGWSTDFSRAEQEAAVFHKFILLNFSGSDWCGPCIRMEKELFSSPEFQAFSDSSLVLVKADFPRQKKNVLSKQQKLQNEQLASQYNAGGSFPLTLLLNEKGEVIKQWDGYQNTKPTEFTSQVRSAIAAAKHRNE